MTPEPLSLLSASVLVVISIAGVGLLSRRARLGVPPSLTQFLHGGWAPWCAGAASAAILLFAWGSLSASPVVHDERAYLLQADIFARGRVTAPPPPIPAFFEQMHVFVEPVTFAKYPPVHSLVLALGVLVGLPGLMPVLLTGVAGGLGYWLARRVTDPWVALLAWLLWSTASIELTWRASYFSQTTNSVLWLLAVWALLRWLDTTHQRFLAIVAAAIALGIHTRPLTMGVLAIPIGVVVAARIWRARLWPQLAGPAALGVAILALGPMWNHATVGDWRVSPYEHYSDVYFPFDKPGFGFEDRAPSRPLPNELRWVGASFVDLHARHQPAALPSIVLERLAGLGRWLGDGWRIGLLLFFFAAVVQASRFEWFGLISAAGVLAAYLVFAHPPFWTVYYVEVLPVFFLLVSHEVVRSFQRIEAGRLLLLGAPRPAAADTTLTRPAASAAVMTAVLLLATLMLPVVAGDVWRTRRELRRAGLFDATVDALLASIPEPRAIVFVPFSPAHNYHRGLIRNTADPTRAHVWVVYDRGPDNQRLLDVAPDRAVYTLLVPSLRLVKAAPVDLGIHRPASTPQAGVS